MVKWPARPKPDFRPAFWIRHTLWRNVFHALGGYRVRGEVPQEPVVVVANHSSHADALAIVAALDSRHRPVAAAASDYWFERPWRRVLLAGAGPAIPVGRGGGGYAALSQSAGQALRRGDSVLLFPEGTRTKDGSLGAFRSGPMWIAREHGVPLVPVAIVGTRQLLPKGGRLRPGPVEVRVGAPISPNDWDERGMERARAAIAHMLAAGPARPSLSRTWRTLTVLMANPAGLGAAAAWGFAEAVSWPVTAEVFLLLAGVANPRRIPAAALALTAGTVVGVVANAALTRRGTHVPAPLTTRPMEHRVRTDMAAGPQAVWKQALNGIPIKLYAREAGRRDLPLSSLAAHTAAARGLRNLAIGGTMGVLAHRNRDLLARFYGPYATGATLAFAIGLGAVIRAWRTGGKHDTGNTGAA